LPCLHKQAKQIVSNTPNQLPQACHVRFEHITAFRNGSSDRRHHIVCWATNTSIFGQRMMSFRNFDAGWRQAPMPPVIAQATAAIAHGHLRPYEMHRGRSYVQSGISDGIGLLSHILRPSFDVPTHTEPPLALVCDASWQWTQHVVFTRSSR